MKLHNTTHPNNELHVSYAIHQAWLRSGIRPTRSAGLINIKPTAEHPCYAREYWVLLATDAENITVIQGTEKTSLSPLQCIAIAPGFPFQIENHTEKPTTIIDIGFNVIHSQTLQENPLAYIQFKPLNINKSTYDRLLEIMQSNNRYTYANYNQQMRTGYLLDEIISEGLIELTQLNELNTAIAIPQWIDNIRIFLDEHFADKVTMAELEAYSGYGQVHIRTTFKKHFGLNPFDYHQQHRMMIACQIIRAGNSLSIKNIAERCGYENISLFHRHFKKLIGMTPNQYRKNNEPGLR